jgi:ABC-2 type transport system ATP-binding protein
LASHLLDEVEKVCSHVVILRKGENLYDGTVDGMLASHGYFELRADDLEKLRMFLEKNGSFSHLEAENDLLMAYLNEPMDAQTLNQLCFKHNIVLSHLVKRKESLEQQFLTLTNNQDA